ncbi:hypothetical protein BGZ96_006561 [Linnemannia gamsii]|uniref:N-acetyltransferase domain-containing protein n=1 Tax=Linnemannia gamsii TaxID=64522 RepID=A0ABQ7K232_9FUNG|nr:hypothetical protein BGZ96_006561 [Linnemannia gamsii]
MSSAYGAIARPLSAGSLGSVLPRHATLRQQPTEQQNGHTNGHSTQDQNNQATLFALSKAPSSTVTHFTLSASTHTTLVSAMHKVFNTEVERGDTYPQEFPLDEEQFTNYFLGGDGFVLIKGDYKDAEGVESRGKAEEWDKDLLGFFYVKPNFPICNGGFMVNPRHRGLGLGGIMGKAFLKVVPLIGYKASMFNLVFESNVASIKLWRRLGFKEIGRIPNAGRLRGQGELGGDAKEGYVDAIQFYWDFESMPVPVEYGA